MFEQCQHPATTLRVKTGARGQRFAMQCDECGLMVGPWLQRGAIDVHAAKPWDDEIWKRRIARQNAEWDAKRAADDAAWWQRYHEHLASQKWRDICALVREREQGLCQGCRRAPGNHVHHLKYDRLGDELLIDLALLCRACHAKAHPHRFTGGAS